MVNTVNRGLLISIITGGNANDGRDRVRAALLI
jgi:hypothetical protein